MAANQNFVMISGITDTVQDYSLCVRIVKMWVVPEVSRPQKTNSIEMVLTDAEVII
jgi:hypothetical protein